MGQIEIAVFQGEQTEKILRELAEFRIKNFKHYPYLYDGDMEEETRHLETYADNEESAIYMAKSDGAIVGVATVIPLEFEYAIGRTTRKMFREIEQEVKDYCFLSEFILDTEHRGKGIASQLFHTLEEDVREAGYMGICFLVVDREANHPLKPADFSETDGLWRHMGYENSGLGLEMEWPTLQPDGGSEMMKNKVSFWTKAL